MTPLRSLCFGGVLLFGSVTASLINKHVAADENAPTDATRPASDTLANYRSTKLDEPNSRQVHRRDSRS